MAFSFNVVPEERIAYVTASGMIDVRSAVRAFGELADQPEFEPEFGIVVDLRDVAQMPETLSELRVLAWTLQHDREKVGRRIAVVFSQDRDNDSAERMSVFNDLSSAGLATFDDVPSAAAWAQPS